MKALTLTQPWASLVALGAKRFETRSWKTDYRGPLAIHAAKGMPKAGIAQLLGPGHWALPWINDGCGRKWRRGDDRLY